MDEGIRQWQTSRRIQNEVYHRNDASLHTSEKRARANSATGLRYYGIPLTHQ